MEGTLLKPKPLVITDGLTHIGVVVQTFSELHEKSQNRLKLNTTLQILAFNQKNEHTLIEGYDDLHALSPHQVLMVIPLKWQEFELSIEKICEMLRKDPKNLYFLTEKDFVNLRNMNVNEVIKSGKYTLKELERIKKMAKEHLWRDQELLDRLDFIDLCKVQTAKSNPNQLNPILIKDNEDKQSLLTSIIKNVAELYEISTEELHTLASMDLKKMIPLHGIMAKQLKENASRIVRFKKEISSAKSFLQVNQFGCTDSTNANTKPASSSNFKEQIQISSEPTAFVSISSLPVKANKMLNTSNTAELSPKANVSYDEEQFVLMIPLKDYRVSCKYV